MGVYTDGIHLVADTEDELHRFARRIGLRHEWFQAHRHAHYDLLGQMVSRAVRHGAVRLGRKAFVAKLREIEGQEGGYEHGREEQTKRPQNG